MELNWREGSDDSSANPTDRSRGTSCTPKAKQNSPFVPPTPINQSTSFQELRPERTAKTIIDQTRSEAESESQTQTQTQSQSESQSQTQSQPTSVSESSTVDVLSSLPMLTPATSHNGLYINEIPQEGSPGFARASEEIRRSEEESKVSHHRGLTQSPSLNVIAATSRRCLDSRNSSATFRTPASYGQKQHVIGYDPPTWVIHSTLFSLDHDNFPDTDILVITQASESK